MIDGHRHVLFVGDTLDDPDVERVLLELPPHGDVPPQEVPKVAAPVVDEPPIRVPRLRAARQRIPALPGAMVSATWPTSEG
jgi:hypothetical protein